MLETDTFLTELYVMADDFVKTQPPDSSPGPKPALSTAEVITLMLWSQLYRFRSERDFYRFARTHLLSAFPRLPHRTQFNRLVRRRHDALVAFFAYIAETLSRGALYEALDTTAVPVRNAKRGGAGHLAGQAAIGLSRRLGWYEGFHLLVSVSPSGVVTGFGFSSAGVSEQRLCETFLALRAHPEEAAAAGLASVGRSCSGYYVCDKGFQGQALAAHWLQNYGATVLVAPRVSSSKRRWGHALERQLSSLRQVVETAIGALEGFFGLQRDRPHELSGLRVRLAAKMALHDFCIWLNRRYGRPDLAFADLIAW